MRAILGTFGRDLAYQVLALPASVLAFTVVVSGVSVAFTALGIIIGFPLIGAVFAVVRWNARIERRRAALTLREPVREAYRPRTGNILRRLRVVTGDPQTWKDLAWLMFLGSVGFVVSITLIVAWGTVLGTLFLPAWYWSLPEPAQFGLIEVDSLGTAFLAADIAVVAIPVLYVLQRWVTVGEVKLGRVLLSPSREAALRARVEELAATRAGVVDAAAAELHRIERDLHDGAQARLVALALDLGMAEERFARDPQGAMELVGEAREEAKRALAELRDLARGIRPSMLAERGLGPALTALAARSPVPAGVDLDIPGGCPAAVENAAWFVVSEALANAGKHSGAARVVVTVRGENGKLIVEVADDGVGGADPVGDGLTGLRRRVEALDGALEVVSPQDGPTTIRAELPCAS